MATIHRKRLRSGDVVWELTHGTGADRQRLTVGRSREEAQHALEQFNRQLALHGQAPTGDSVDAVVGTYLAFLKSNRRKSTYRRYARVIRTFGRCYLGVLHSEIKRLRDVRPQHIEEYKCLRLEGGIAEIDESEDLDRDRVLKREVEVGPKAKHPRDNAKYGWLGRKRLRTRITPRTVNYELQVLRTFFHWCIKRNVLFVNPGSTIERYRVPKRALPKFATVEELKQLFAACDDDERRLFMTILMSGMRRGEVETLSWSDVNFELGVVFIQEHPELDWKPKTDERLIPMSDSLRKILLMQYAERRDNGLVFPNAEGQRDTHILEKLKRICRKAGLRPINVHALRHSFGAHLRMAGVSLADIADLLGHRDLATTSIYAKVHQEHLRGAVSKLSPVIESATTLSLGSAGTSSKLTPRKTRRQLTP